MKSSFAHVKIAVLGDIILDEYLYLIPSDSSAEENAPIYLMGRKEHFLGGAANVAYNLAQMGVQTTLFGRIASSKSHTSGIIEELSSNINLSIVRCDVTPTTVKQRLVFNNSILARIDQEVCEALTPFQTEKTISKLKSFVSLNPDAMLIVSDYNKGVVNSELMREVKSLWPKKRILIDPKPRKGMEEIYKDCEFMKPNLKEAFEILEIKTQEEKNSFDYNSLAQRLIDKFNLNSVCISLGGKGAFAQDRDGEEILVSPEDNIHVF